MIHFRSLTSGFKLTTFVIALLFLPRYQKTESNCVERMRNMKMTARWRVELITSRRRHSGANASIATHQKQTNKTNSMTPSWRNQLSASAFFTRRPNSTHSIYSISFPFSACPLDLLPRCHFHCYPWNPQPRKRLNNLALSFTLSRRRIAVDFVIASSQRKSHSRFGFIVWRPSEDWFGVEWSYRSESHVIHCHWR